jgi:hypothetical protein
MRRTSTLYATVLLGSGTAVFAQAVAPDRAQMVQQYASMCMNESVELPAPMGESDLKGNPKLEAYCQCFSGKFADRAIRRLQNPGPPPPPLKQTRAEERSMRNDCRQQLGLPVLTFPQ